MDLTPKQVKDKICSYHKQAFYLHFLLFLIDTHTHMIKRRQSSTRVLHLTQKEFEELPLGVEPEQIDSMLRPDSPLPSSLSASDVQQLTLLKTKLKGITRKQQEGDFICDMQQILQFLQSDTLGQKKEVVLFIMYKIERFLLKPKTGPQKLQLAVKLLSPLFSGDEDTTQTVIELCMREHKQIKRLGRVMLRTYRYFFKKD